MDSQESNLAASKRQKVPDRGIFSPTHHDYFLSSQGNAVHMGITPFLCKNRSSFGSGASDLKIEGARCTKLSSRAEPLAQPMIAALVARLERCSTGPVYTLCLLSP